jgi:transcription termination factor NusB
MLKKIYENFKRGTGKIKWFATLFSERVDIEIAVFRLLYQSDEMAKKRDEHLKAIGERVVEQKEHGEKNIFRDSVVAEALDEIGKIDRNIEDLRHKASEISRVTG